MGLGRRVSQWLSRAYVHRDEIKTLDPAVDYLRIYQLTTLYDFIADAKMGLNLAFYRVFSVPHIAELLVRTGEMTGRPAKRSYDTALLMYELIAAGLDHPQGREAIRIINKAHRPWPISDEDFRYVLTAFVVVPMRWIDHRGWRPLLPAEREASAAFYRDVARHMNIPNPPETYAEAAALFDDYERRWLGPSDAGKQLMNATQAVIVRKVPTMLHGIAPALTSALLDDPKLTDALGLQRPSLVNRILVTLVYRARNIRTRLRGAAIEPWFITGRPVYDVYPHGYQLAHLGPSGDSPDD
jgi:hypothetical protein